MGFAESADYRELIEKHANLWSDTAMVLSDYFPVNEKIALSRYRSERIVYGSDFPNIPYAWDREIKELMGTTISHQSLERITYKNAAVF